MIGRFRSVVRETIDRYVLDPEQMTIADLKTEIDSILASGLPQTVKDQAFLIRSKDWDDYPCWKLVWDRDETDQEMAERIAREEHEAWVAFSNLAENLKGTSPPIPHDAECFDNAIGLIAEVADQVLLPGRRLHDAADQRRDRHRLQPD